MDKRSFIDRENKYQEKETEIKKEQELIFCSQCGGQIKESIAKYCYHCGAKLIEN